MAIRAIVTMRLTGELDVATELMREVASYTREHFGESVLLSPFVDDATGRIVWLNVASDEESLVRWEQNMGDRTGFRSRVRDIMEPIGMDLLDPVTDPRLERLRNASTAMRSMLD